MGDERSDWNDMDRGRKLSQERERIEAETRRQDQVHVLRWTEELNQAIDNCNRMLDSRLDGHPLNPHSLPTVKPNCGAIVNRAAAIVQNERDAPAPLSEYKIRRYALAFMATHCLEQMN